MNNDTSCFTSFNTGFLSRRLKILRVINSVNPQSGGPIEGIKQLSPYLRALGVEEEIACCDAPDAPWLGSHGLPAVYAFGETENKYGYTRLLLPWLRENASRYDAVMVHGIWQYHSFATRKALHGTRTPYFVFTHGMLDPWFKHKYPLKHMKKWLYWPWAEYRVLRDAKAVIFTCEEERLLARQSFSLYQVNERVTAYGTAGPPGNGKELALRFLSANPHLQGKRIALFLGRIHEKKGCDLLLTAFAKVMGENERLHLIMAGPDQTGLAAVLRQHAEKIGISKHVTWPGMLQGDDKWGAIYAAEAFCLPSHQENFGIVIAEALACGKPVLISNKVNIWREVKADSAGFVDEDSIAGTLRNLQRWLNLDANSYTEMSNRASLCFTQRFHIRKAATRLFEIIDQNSVCYVK